MLIDTHSHLYAQEFDDDRDAAVARAEAAGVGRVFLPAIDKESYDRQEALAASRPDLFCQMMGLHPTSVGAGYEADLQLVHDKLFAQPDKYVAVGEIGLDLYWDTTYRDAQLDALQRQIVWAETLDKPVVLHIRNAYAEAFDLLERHGSPSYRGIMHCFSGTLDDARRAVGMGFLLGIGGVVTFKKSTLPDIVRDTPLENMVLETDAPYLAPVPHRGKRNESAFIVYVAQRIAELKGVDVATVADTTSYNAIKLFLGKRP